MRVEWKGANDNAAHAQEGMSKCPFYFEDILELVLEK